MKKTACLFLAAFSLAGCVSFVVPPESVYNGRYLNVTESNGLFLYDIDTQTDQGCAFLATNSAKIMKNGERATCSKTRNELVTHSTVVKSFGQDALEFGFNGIVSCRKMLQTERLTVVRDCAPV